MEDIKKASVDIKKVVETTAKEVKVDPRQLFVKEYETLVNKHNLQLSCTPTFKLRDDGTYSIVLKYDVITTQDLTKK